MKTMKTEDFLKRMDELEEDISFACFAAGYVKEGHVTIIRRKNQAPALYAQRSELMKIQEWEEARYAEDED